MAYAKQVNGYVQMANTQVDQSWVLVTSQPESAEYREVWYLDGSDIKEDTSGVAERVATAHRKEQVKIRDKALASMVYDFGDGRVMQVRTTDEANLLRALKAMTSYGLVEIDWVMEDNKKYSVTAADIEAALASGLLQGMQIWSEYAP